MVPLTCSRCVAGFVLVGTLAALSASAGLFSDSVLHSSDDVVIVSFATNTRIHISPRSHLPRIPLRRDQFFCLDNIRAVESQPFVLSLGSDDPTPLLSLDIFEDFQTVIRDPNVFY